MRMLSVILLGSGVSSGEGLAVQDGPGGRRTLFVVAEHAPADSAAVDVTDPLRPSVLGRELHTGRSPVEQPGDLR
jgi:hypothetical protein